MNLRFRAYRRTILSTLGMAAIVIGLLAMHSPGTEPPPAAHLPAATALAAAGHIAHTGHTGHTAHTFHATEAPPVMATVIAATTALVGDAASALPCDDACMHGVLDCAAMVMTGAMLLAAAALIVFARPVVYRTPHDIGARIVAALRGIPLAVHRPDLTALSISRT